MTDTDTRTDTPPPPAEDGGDDHRPPLVRRRRGRLVAGVAMGLARHLRIDVTLVRIGFVVLAFTGGAGILAYLAAWVLLPEEDEHGVHSPAPGTETRGVAFWLGVALLVIASIVLVEHTTPFGQGIGTPLVLIAVGVALWKVSQDRADRRDAPPAPAPGPAPSDTAPSPAGRPDAAVTPTAVPPGDASPPGGAAPPPGDAPAATAWVPPPAPRRPRSVLGRVTVALAFIAVGAGVAADQAGLATFTPADASATALAVVGGGLVVGAWFGRARGLIALGVVLVPVVVVTSVLRSADLPYGAGAGDRYVTVAAASDLAPRYELGAGYLRLDLSDLDELTGDVRSEVRVGAGEIEILVPDGTPLVVDATVHVGHLELPGTDRTGPHLAERLELPGGPGPGAVHLDVELGAGEVSVTIVPTPEEPA